MSRAQIEMLIADKVLAAEMANAAALGHDGLDIAGLSFGAFCGVLILAGAAERQAVLTRFRPIGAAHG